MNELRRQLELARRMLELVLEWIDRAAELANTESVGPRTSHRRKSDKNGASSPVSLQVATAPVPRWQHEDLDALSNIALDVWRKGLGELATLKSGAWPKKPGQVYSVELYVGISGAWDIIGKIHQGPLEYVESFQWSCAFPVMMRTINGGDWEGGESGESGESGENGDYKVSCVPGFSHSDLVVILEGVMRRIVGRHP